MPSDIKFTSAATNDSFMLQPSQYVKGDIVALDRAYIDYEKFEMLTRNGVIYVTKLKKNLKYTIQKDIMHMNEEGQMDYREQYVTFTKDENKEKIITHHIKIATYVDIKKASVKFVHLLTNDMEPKDIVEIYRKRWGIEFLFKQLKQNFPLRYFYGESANAIKIQIWVTLIANLLLMVVKKRVKNRSWSSSGLATMIRITLMYYINCYSFLNNPDKDWENLIAKSNDPPSQLSLFD